MRAALRLVVLIVAVAVAAGPGPGPVVAGPEAGAAGPARAAGSAGPGTGPASPARAAAPAQPRWETLPLPPAMPKPEDSGYASVPGGARIYYATFGKAGAPAVILLHGGLGNGEHFAHQVPALADRFRVITIDSRGQGRSTLGTGGTGTGTGNKGKDKGTDKLSYAVMARDVIAVMDALRIEKASVVGWSDGGAVALALGIEHGGRLDRLFVFATNYDSRGSKARAVTTTTFAAYSARCRADFARLANNKGAFEAAAAALAPVWRDPASFTKQQLRAIKARTLVGSGDHDEIIQLDQVKEMAQLIPNARLAILPDTSHFAMWQDPAGFNKVLVEFLTSP
ncbi:MAG TPA: alpha/beta hydrolase [Kofleriaceae bacterium]|nr:alpha/beta hydrolase [Kofleriaceae bacterium]